MERKITPAACRSPSRFYVRLLAGDRPVFSALATAFGEESQPRHDYSEAQSKWCAEIVLVTHDVNETLLSLLEKVIQRRLLSRAWRLPGSRVKAMKVVKAPLLCPLCRERDTQEPF